MNPTDLQQHPLGKLFPPMTDEEFADLKKDIQDHGFSAEHNIVIHEEMILDGYHRHLAALEVGVRANYKRFIAPDMADSPLDFVLQENLHRRHLNAVQRAAIAMEAIGIAIDGLNYADGQTINEPLANIAKIKSEAEKDEQIAKIAKVSPRTVRAAKKAAEEPEKAKAKEEKKNSARGAAVRIIDGILGKDWCEKSKLGFRELVKLSGIESEEMKRIEPFLRAGWTVEASLGHKSVALLPVHAIRDCILRAIALGGKMSVEMRAEGRVWDVSVREVAP